MPTLSPRKYFLGDRVIHAINKTPMEVRGFYQHQICCYWQLRGRDQTRWFDESEIEFAPASTPIAEEITPVVVGMRVRHVLGGPHMIVSAVEHDVAWCEWQTAMHTQSKQLPVRELRPIDDVEHEATRLTA